MQVNLKDKVALVTGAARGIGRAIADTLAKNGAQVAYTDIDEEAVLQVAPGGADTGHRLDVADPDSISAGIQWVTERFGRLDILINNAGINTVKHRVTLDQFPLDEWERIVRVDLTGCFMMTKAALPVLRQQPSSRIVNIASVLGVIPARQQCAYVAAKSGIVNLTRATALEFAPEVLVNCIAPGSTLTDGTRHLFYGDSEDSQSAAKKEQAQRMLSHVPLGRPGTVEEIAHAALFLVAPESSYITGQVLCVDGGWTTGGFFRDF